MSETEEAAGLDASLHGEGGYDFGLEAAFAFDGGASPTDFAPDYAGEVAYEGAAGD